MERKFLLDSLLEHLAFLESERIGLGDHGNNIDDIRQLLQNNDVNGLESIDIQNDQSLHALNDRHMGHDSRMARGLDEKQAAVDTGILDITVTLSSKFLAEVCRMLVLDVLHNRVPTECVISSIRTDQ